MTKLTTEIRDLLKEADDAFWQVIVEHFPQATTGDLSPMTTVRLHQAQHEAVTEWISANVPRIAADAVKGIDHD